LTEQDHSVKDREPGVDLVSAHQAQVHIITDNPLYTVLDAEAFRVAEDVDLPLAEDVDAGAGIKETILIPLPIILLPHQFRCPRKKS
jgi:hypothetical protein